MKRTLFITVITVLAEFGAYAAICWIYLVFTSGELLIGMILASILSALAGVMVWEILDVNMKGGRKRCKRALQK